MTINQKREGFQNGIPWKNVNNEVIFFAVQIYVNVL